MSLVEISNPIISPVIYDKQCCSGVCINICFLNKTFATEITVRLAISNDIDSDYICQEWVYHVSRASPICCTPTYPISAYERDLLNSYLSGEKNPVFKLYFYKESGADVELITNENGKPITLFR